MALFAGWMCRVCQHTNLFEIENLITFLVALTSQHPLQYLKCKQCNLSYCHTTPEAAARAGVKRYVLAGSSKAVATNLKKISRHVDAEELKGLGDLDWSLGHRVDIATRMCVHCTHTTTLARISAWYPFMSCEGAICQLDKHLFRR
jgi:hypothetical protein